MTEQQGRPQDEGRRGDRQGKNVDLVGDLQRWFIRQSAKNMRREISGQVRRTLGGGRETSDVWDTATNEIPPEVGESPECQWCPICRAARRMRDSGPGIGGQLSGAGDVVASAVHDAIGALDSLLAKASGTTAARDTGSMDSTGSGGDTGSRGDTRSGGTGTSRDSRDGTGSGGDAGSGDSARSGGDTGSGGDAGSRDTGSSSNAPAGSARLHGVAGTDDPHGPAGAGQDAATPGPGRVRPGLVGLPGGGDSAAGGRPGSGPIRSVPASGAADRLAAAEGKEPDPWGAATGTAEDGQASASDAQSDRPGYGPDDRG